ncbi:Hemolymph lipopolysaccharide-binding protein [Zootermopsis nevadensis]|nr:Hemolymph lipopolysaccharide-binding protein [Zootermopsis nevadensis]
MENVGLIATVSGDCEAGLFEIWLATYCTNTVRPNQDYELVSGVGFYKMHTEAVSWDEVRKACIDEGSHLVILNSLTEVEVVKSIWSKHPIISGSQWPEYIYIGAHDLL